MPSSNPTEVVISEVGIRRWLMRVMALLLIAFVLSAVSKLYLHHDSVYGLVVRFDVFFAATVPTWFAAVCLLSAAGAAGVAAAASQGRPLQNGWATFAVLMLILSVERATGTLRGLIAAIAFGETEAQPASLMTNIPFVVSFLIVGAGLFYLSAERRRFWGALSRRARKGLAVSIGLYLVSTVVLPPLLWWRVELMGWRNAGAYALVSAQWVLEIWAYVMLLSALIAYVARDLTETRIRFTAGE